MRFLLTILLFCCLTGCSISDEDRCNSGYRFDPEFDRCVPVDSNAGGNGRDDAGIDAALLDAAVIGDGSDINKTVDATNDTDAADAADTADDAG